LCVLYKKRNFYPMNYNELPSEILLQIFSYLSVKSLGVASQVCKSWYQGSWDESLWKVLHDNELSQCKYKNKQGITYRETCVQYLSKILFNLEFHDNRLGVPANRITIAMIGDNSVGKSTFISTYLQDKELHSHNSCRITAPKSFKSLDVVFDEISPTMLNVANMYMHSDDYNLCPATKADLVFICFSLSNPQSLEHVADAWAPGLDAINPNAPVILLGLRRDERYLHSEAMIAQMHLLALKGYCTKFCFSMYAECSAFSKSAVNKILERAIEIAFKPFTKQTSGLVALSVMDEKKTFSGLKRYFPRWLPQIFVAWSI